MVDALGVLLDDESCGTPELALMVQRPACFAQHTIEGNALDEQMSAPDLGLRNHEAEASSGRTNVPTFAHQTK